MTPSDQQAERLLEQIARLIEPSAWSYLDRLLAPFVEKRGSYGHEAPEDYGSAWTAGCRTPEQAREWFMGRRLRGGLTAYAEEIEQSLEKARKIIPVVSAALAEKDAEIEMLKSENAWLRRLIQWCHVRLSKDVYREGLLHMLARGVTEVDNAKLVQSTPNEEKS